MPSIYSIALTVNPMMRHDSRTLRGMSRQQKHVPKMKRSIVHAALQ